MRRRQKRKESRNDQNQYVDRRAGEGSLQTPLWDGDIVIVKDGGTPAMGQPDDTPKQSAEMGKADGVQGGKNQGNVPKSRSAMIKGVQSDQGQSE